MGDDNPERPAVANCLTWNDESLKIHRQEFVVTVLLLLLTADAISRILMPGHCSPTRRILFDATHKEYGEMAHSDLRQLLITVGFSVDVHYIQRSDLNVIKEVDFTIDQWNFTTSFFLGEPGKSSEPVPVLVILAQKAWIHESAMITVIEPVGSKFEGHFWAAPHNIHIHEPRYGLWTVSIRQFITRNEPQSNTLTVGYMWTNPINLQLLSKYQMLVLGQANSDLSPREIEDVTTFVREGGSLFICGGSPNLNPLTSPFGIEFTGQTVSDPTNNLKGWLPIIHVFTNHPTVEGLKELVGGRALKLKTPAIGVAFSDGDSDPPNASVIAVSSYGSRRIVAVSDPYTFSNLGYYLEGEVIGFFFKLPDSRRLALNSIGWLSEQESGVSTTSASTLRGTGVASDTPASPFVALGMILLISITTLLITMARARINVKTGRKLSSLTRVIPHTVLSSLLILDALLLSLILTNWNPSATSWVKENIAVIGVIVATMNVAVSLWRYRMRRL